MQPYSYSKLDEASQEIRLVTLLPGKSEDQISLLINHATLLPPTDPPQRRISLEELQKTLPPKWEVLQTVEGRYLFSLEGQKDEAGHDITSWTHPDPNVDRTLYEWAETELSDFHPQYEALSYTWGSKDNPEEILVGDPPTATLKVGQNLWSALRYMRHPNNSRVIWIDAICINQNDDNERGEQVKRMANIYSWASRVVVWLGTPSSNSGLAMTTLKYLGQQLETTIDGYRLRSPQSPEPDWFWSWRELPYSAETWQAIFQLLTRPWFSRLWVYQEIQLANSTRTLIQCGNEEVLWPHFRRALLCLRHKRQLPSPELHTTLISMDALAEKRSGIALLRLLRIMRSRQCSDPKDRIYGLLGLSSPSFAHYTIPQYSLSVAEVYKNAFLLHLEQSRRLEMLEECDLAVRKISGPTWVPDWSTSYFVENLCLDYSSGISRACARYLAPKVLEVTGVTCGTVVTLGEPVVSHDEPEPEYYKYIAAIKKWEPADLKTEIYVTGESLHDAYISAICFGMTKERAPRLLFPTLTEWSTMLLSNVEEPASPTAVQALSDKFGGRVLRRLAGRTYATISNGFMGLVPTATQLGDHITVLLGCNTPIVLRETPDNQFKVIGSCYIHGLMEGESLFGQLPEPWKVQIHVDSSGIRKPYYVNTITGESTDEGRWLGPLPSEWEHVPTVRTPEDPILFTRFRNKNTGELVNWDPRLLPAPLEARGVKLRKFELI